MPYFIENLSTKDSLMVVNDNVNSSYGLEDNRIENKCKTLVAKLNKKFPDDNWIVIHKEVQTCKN